MVMIAVLFWLIFSWLQARDAKEARDATVTITITLIYLLNKII